MFLLKIYKPFRDPSRYFECPLYTKKEGAGERKMKIKEDVIETKREREGKTRRKKEREVENDRFC